MRAFPDVTFYDYTKVAKRRRAKGFPANYHLTFSLSEDNDRLAYLEANEGSNVAVVFDVRKGAPLPDTFAGRPVIDGDISDMRFKDPRGVIVGLRAKGSRGKSDTSGFVRSPDAAGFDLARQWRPAVRLSA
jgi:hypothetical protein